MHDILEIRKFRMHVVKKVFSNNTNKSAIIALLSTILYYEITISKRITIHDMMYTLICKPILLFGNNFWKILILQKKNHERDAKLQVSKHNLKIYVDTMFTKIYLRSHLFSQNLLNVVWKKIINLMRIFS